MTDVFTPEREALAAVAAGARAQLAALREGATETFEAAAAETLGAVADLDRRRRARPAGGVADQTELRAAAQDARRACDELQFALEHAVALGRDLIGAWHRVAAPPAAQVYTAAGSVGAAPAGRLQQTG